MTRLVMLRCWGWCRCLSLSASYHRSVSQSFCCCSRRQVTHRNRHTTTVRTAGLFTHTCQTGAKHSVKQGPHEKGAHRQASECQTAARHVLACEDLFMACCDI